MIRRLSHGMKNFLQQWTGLPEKDPVLVYSMRKVASTTVTKTLRNNDVNVYKMHLLNPGLIEEYRRAFAAAGGSRDHSIIEGIQFKKRLDRWRKKSKGAGNAGRLKIFTFVKDPVAIAVSDYFMQLFIFLPHVVKDRGLHSAEELVKLFEEVLWVAAGRGSDDPAISYIGKICALPQIWFDKELKCLTGVDVLKNQFPIDAGMAFYEGDDSDIALIRTDNLSQVGLQAINQLVGINPPELITSNVRGNTAQGELYKSFSKRVVLPEELVRKIYAVSHMGHFYTNSEIESFVNKWVSARN